MRLYVGNLSWSATEQDVRAHFAAIGPVKDAKLITDRETGRSRGFAFVTMQNSADAERAMAELGQAEFMGRRLNISEANDRPRTGGQRDTGRPARQAAPAPVVEHVQRFQPGPEFCPPPDSGGRRSRGRRDGRRERREFEE